MFYLRDLLKETVLKFENAVSLAAAWLKIFPNRDFSELNVTGSDLKMTFSNKTCKAPRIDSVTGETYYVREFIPIYQTRRFLITDETGRHVDIRLWDESIWAQAVSYNQHRYSWPFASGSKSRWNRQSGPSGHHRTMRAVSQKFDDELELLTSAQVNTIHMGNRNVIPDMMTWDWYEYRANRKYTCSKCWKDQAKSARQFAKHKPGKPGRAARAQITETGDELCARLAQALCGKNAAA